MRVLLVNAHGDDPSYGGAERYVRDLARGLAARGHEVRILAAFPSRGQSSFPTHVMHRSDWREDWLRRVRNHAGDVISAPWPGLRRAVRATGADLVHTSNLPGIGSGVWEAARRSGVPVVHTLHDYHLLCPRTSLVRADGTPCEPSPWLCGARTRRMARWAGAVDELIAGSEHLLGSHRALFPGVGQHLVRLPFAPLEGAPTAVPPAPPKTLGYLGALTTIKGVELLLAAAPALAERGVELRIAGDGPLRGMVQDAGVHWAGRVDGTAKVDFLASCDAGIVPSLWEEPSGPPYVVCEWLAARRPVLTTRRGGLGELVDRAGVIDVEGTVPGIVEAATRLREPSEWRQVTAALPSIDDDADVQRWLSEHEAVYRAAAGTAAGAERS